ncbi:uncharacterized protein LOC110465866 isoform X2 [Mizuhopecten yessoensis]|uniref:uncharacterized protein LOC110465866 isoform X2 n=1 Tax=Mizuhopecten yessoensis TaxID=6573 RepID=UPI000B45D96E|nr:uncharacterized protein LOC110465866 isoform X2 [Mizuhopecten yessoensis]
MVSMTTSQNLHELWKRECCPTAKQLLINHQLPSAVQLLQDNPDFPGTADALLEKHSFPKAVELLDSRPPCQSALELLKSQHFPVAKELLQKHFPQTAEDLLKVYHIHTAGKLFNKHTDQNAVGLLKKYNFLTVGRLLEDRKSDCILAKTHLKKHNIVTCPGCRVRYSDKVSQNLRHQNYLGSNIGDAEPIYATVQPRKQRNSTTVLHGQINSSPVQHGRPNTSTVLHEQPKKSEFWSNITCVLCPRRRHGLLLDEEYCMNIDEEEEDIYEDISNMSLVLAWPNSENEPHAN